MRLSIACGTVVVVVAVLVSARTAEQNDRGSPTSFAFVHATVIDGTGAAPKRDQMVLVTGTRITAIGNSPAIQIPPAAQMLDSRGKFLIPGLWDMHVHIRGGKDLATANEAFLTLYVANGVTGIREMGGPGAFPAEAEMEFSPMEGLLECAHDLEDDVFVVVLL